MAVKSFKYGFQSSGFLNLSAAEAYKEVEENCAIIVDVREQSFTAFKKFGIQGVIYMPFSHLPEQYVELPKDVPLIIADTVGLHSRNALLFLKDQGFENIANLAGGFVDWERYGLPVNKDITQQLDGSCICQLKPRH